MALVRTIKQADIAWQPIPMESSILCMMQVIGCVMKMDELTKAFKHICWDGCMFPNEVMIQQQTWNDILATMIKVRKAHGWHQRKQK